MTRSFFARSVVASDPLNELQHVAAILSALISLATAGENHKLTPQQQKAFFQELRRVADRVLDIANDLIDTSEQTAPEVRDGD